MFVFAFLGMMFSRYEVAQVFKGQKNIKKDYIIDHADLVKF